MNIRIVSGLQTSPPLKTQSEIKFSQHLLSQNNKTRSKICDPYPVTDEAAKIESSAPGTNYDPTGKKASLLKPISIEALKTVLSQTLTNQKVGCSLFNEKVCDSMSALLANELNRKKIPYRIVERKLRGSDPKKTNLIHSSLRVFVKDTDGKAKWLIVDPTCGQWFKDGTIDRKGNFISKEIILSGKASPIFIGTHQELQKAVLKNINRLDFSTMAYLKTLKVCDRNNQGSCDTNSIVRNDHYSSDGKIAALFVLQYYKKPNDVGSFTFTDDWQPKNLSEFKKINSEIDLYYKSSNFK